MSNQRKYKLVFAKKAELTTRKGEIIFLTSDRDATRYTLTPDQFTLAKLFDGNRSADEVQELYTKTTGASLSKADFDQFVENLKKASLLQHTAAPLFANKRTSPPYLRYAAQSHNSAVSSPGDDTVSHLPNTLWPRGDFESDDGHETTDMADEITPAETEEERWMRSGEAAHHRFSGTAERVKKAGPAGTFGQEVKLVARIPIGWFMPLATFLTLPARSATILALVLFADLLGGFGLWFNRVDMASDLSRLLEPLALAQTLLISMFSVNLLGQLARAGAATIYSDKRPPFGIALAFNLLPRFYTSLSEHHGLLSLEQRRGILRSSLFVNLTLFGLTTAFWLMTKDSGTYLPLLFIGIAALSVARIVLSINPLSKRAGYYLLSAKLRIPLLRERALLTLVNWKQDVVAQGQGGKQISVWALRLYGILVLLWLVTFAVIITKVLGGWLETHWGGLGIIVFITVASISLWSPIKQAKAFRKRYAEFLLAPAQKVATPAQGTFRGRAVKVLLLIGLTILAVLPYTYEPGGQFELLPLPDRRMDVRAQIEAQLSEIYVSEGDHVEKGQMLARLVDDTQQKNSAVAEATLQQLNTKLNKALAGPTKEEIAAAKQRVETARINYNFSKSQKERYVSLFKKGAVSTQDYEDSVAKADNRRELLSQAQKDLDLLLAGVRQEDIAAIRAEIAQQTAELEYSRQRMTYTELRAPISGEIASGSLLTAAGSYLERGDLFTIIEDNRKLLAEIKIPQADIGEVRVGAQVRIKTWTYPDREFTGVVQSIAPSADDSPYGKVVRVMTAIDNSEGLLKSSLTGQAKIIGEQKMVIVAFTRMLVRFFRVELWSWLP